MLNGDVPSYTGKIYIETARVRVIINATPGISWRSLQNLTMYQSSGERSADGKSSA